uniref:NADH-ubiquinone oxidoreductase chain 4 n=1 Tax=Cryptolestes pusillus TaxID=1173686 RepID=A0A0U2N3C9_9CUCU|nr:NADH dehydrogenase subunit 4 [Cryptolestes pusillus]ALI87011.1 NADH dehydrogenase subunit 4 [Cryptolestes pusillus]
MMKFIFFLIFLIPLSFLNLFWLFQVLLFLIKGLFLMMFSFNNQFINISYLFGLDLLSYCLVLLSFWVCALMVLASEKIYLKNSFYKLFMLVMIILLISLVLTFSSLNLFIFYLFFEIKLIPTLMLIIGWGYQPERVEAGMYLLFYTLLVSLPMMMSIFYFYSNFYSLKFTLSILLNYEINNFLVFFVMIFIFLVKFPMFFVHLWLPKAHVEAPVSGSMILAGIMLKLGGYGLIRVIPLFMKLNISINWFFIVISMVGGFIVSLICIRQSDMKSLIAYSSVAHMGMVLGGLMTLNYWGMWGALVMMLAHVYVHLLYLFGQYFLWTSSYAKCVFKYGADYCITFFNIVVIFIYKVYYSGPTFNKFISWNFINKYISFLMNMYNNFFGINIFFMSGLFSMFICLYTTWFDMFKFMLLMYSLFTWVSFIDITLFTFKYIIYKKSIICIMN